MKRKKLTRRDFIKGAALTGAGLALGSNLLSKLEASAQDPKIYLPLIFKSPPPSSKVVHVRDASATDWDGTGSFYNAVDQGVVDAMVQVGLQNLTGQNTWTNIWNTLFNRVHSGGYSAGQKIAIKVNFNSSEHDSNDCDSHNNLIDALPQPVLALVKGMVAAGVQPNDITIYDATGKSTGMGRIIPNYFRTPITAVYSNVNFVGRGDCSGVIPASHGKDPSLTVQFPGSTLLARQLADVLYDATYLINVPILKRHGGDNAIPVTLGFKNHLGSLDKIYDNGSNDMHNYLNTSRTQYRDTYSPLVDIYSNPNVGSKTVLTLGDGLYGSAFGQACVTWNIFGDAFNSLFFATDPVAVDCVMADFLVAEGLVSTAHTYDYLFCAAEAGLGVCEGARGNPGGNPLQEPYGSGYSLIDYVRVDL